MDVRYAATIMMLAAIIVTYVAYINYVEQRRKMNYKLLSKVIVTYNINASTYSVNGNIAEIPASVYSEQIFIANMESSSSDMFRATMSSIMKKNELPKRPASITLKSGEKFNVLPYHKSPKEILMSFTKSEMPITKVNKAIRRNANKLDKQVFRADVSADILSQIEKRGNPYLVLVRIPDYRRLVKKYSSQATKVIIDSIIYKISRSYRKSKITMGNTPENIFVYLPHSKAEEAYEVARMMYAKITTPVQFDGVDLSVQIRICAIKLDNDELVTNQKKIVVVSKNDTTGAPVLAYNKESHEGIFEEYMNKKQSLGEIIKKSGLEYKFMPIYSVKSKKALMHSIYEYPLDKNFKDFDELKWFVQDQGEVKEFERMSVRKMVDELFNSETLRKRKIIKSLDASWLKDGWNLKIPSELTTNLYISLTNWNYSEVLDTKNIIHKIREQGPKVFLPNIDSIFKFDQAIEFKPDGFMISPSYTRKIKNNLQIRDELRYIQKFCKENKLELIYKMDTDQIVADELLSIGAEKIQFADEPGYGIINSSMKKAQQEVINNANIYIY